MSVQADTSTLPPEHAAPADVTVQADAEGRITYWRGDAQGLLGHDQASVVGLTLKSLCPTDHLGEEAQWDAQLRQGCQVGPTPTTRLHRDGHGVPLVLCRVPVMDASGSMAGSVTILHAPQTAAVDNTWAQHFAAVVAHSDDAIVTKTMDGIVTSWNPGAERLFGWTAAEMIGQPMLRVFPADRVDEEAQILARLRAGEQVDHFETERVRKDGSTVQISVSISPVRDNAGRVIGASKIARDISLRVQAERVIRHHATTDPVTALANRRAFNQTLVSALEDAHAERVSMGLLLIDLDHFKAVNDTLGHNAGDKLLRQVARRLKDSVRRQDVVARLGGDEFTVLLRQVGDDDEAMVLARRIRSSLVEPYEIDGRKVEIGASIGVAVFPDDGVSPAALTQHADEAMYNSKAAGGIHPVRLSAAQQAAALDRAALLDDLRGAVAFGQLALEYQPIVNLQTGEIRKVEALARWHHPARGLISPGVFIPLAEGAGLLQRLGDWVFREAAGQAARWRIEGLGDVQVSVNLSPKQLQAEEGYFEGWFRHLKTLALPGTSLIIELTEDMLVDHSVSTRKVLGALRANDMALAIDDFGTGYSNLSALGGLDAQFLKIDRSFVKDLPENQRSQLLCKAMVNMATALGLSVVAEGIETQAQADFLRGIGCQFGQGFLFARPLPPAQLGALLRARRAQPSTMAE